MTGRADWILFKKDAEPEVQKAVELEDKKLNTAPKVIQFDEITGAQLNQQIDFPELQEKAAVDNKLPWRQWRSQGGSSLGDKEADKAAAVAVLNSLHANFAVDLEPIEMWQQAGHGDKAGRSYVTATRIASPGEIMLPPCVPKQSTVLERSEHPYTVEIALRVVRPTDTQVGDDTPLRKVSFFVNPEFKTPKHQEVNAAGSDVAAVADEWIWGPLGDHTMHPFWAVRRMTQRQMSREAAEAKEGARRLRFNCRLEAVSMSCVNVGVVKSQSVSTTRVCNVPFLTNSLEVDEGEELILEVREKTQVQRETKRTWRDAVKEANQKKEATSSKQDAKKAKS